MKDSAPVPGSLNNAVTLLNGLEVKYGLVKLRNIGEYGLAVGAIDKKGNLIQPHCYLNPGEAISSYIPPSDAVKIVLVGEKQIANEPAKTGVSVLDYDVPWYW